MTEETSPDPSSDGFAAAVATIANARVLVIDDDPVQCRNLADAIERWGGVTSTAHAFTEALRLHRESEPDLVLMDVIMPDMDGFKLAQTFKRETPGVPIILLTAMDDLRAKRRAHAAGADELLTKPINLVELQIRVSSMIRIKHLNDQIVEANVKLSELALLDPLTQIANRRALTDRLIHEVERSKRYRHPFSCLLIDIDHFKRVNDEFGHPAGDAVLREVAGAIAQSVRNTDLAGRYGGEEFMVLAPETRTRDAQVLGERIRARVSAPCETGPSLLRTTVSIGIASTDSGAVSPGDLVASADAALYEAKRGGRNRVVLAT
jgi:two-component system cell cycle response regulator